MSQLILFYTQSGEVPQHRVPVSLPTPALEPSPARGRRTPGLGPLWALQHSSASSRALPCPCSPWHPQFPPQGIPLLSSAFSNFLGIRFYSIKTMVLLWCKSFCWKIPFSAAEWLVINVHGVAVSRQFIISRRCALSGKWILSYGYSRFTT